MKQHAKSKKDFEAAQLGVFAIELRNPGWIIHDDFQKSGGWNMKQEAATNKPRVEYSSESAER